jgi:hypothetical protein
MSGVTRDWRTANLHPDYEYRPAPEHGMGLWAVHRVTGEVCDCRLTWNADGTVLSCPVCGLEGT